MPKPSKGFGSLILPRSLSWPVYLHCSQRGLRWHGVWSSRHQYTSQTVGDGNAVLRARFAVGGVDYEAKYLWRSDLDSSIDRCESNNSKRSGGTRRARQNDY